MEDISKSERKRIVYMLNYRGNTLDRIKKLAEDALEEGGSYVMQGTLIDIIKEVENGK